MNGEAKNELAAALAKAQGEFLTPEKDSINPHFGNKFASLVSIRAATQAALSKHGLALTHLLVPTKEGGLELHSSLVHTSGQSITSAAPINPARKDAQGIGSAVTYMKRYNTQALLNIVGDEAEDDDGEAAVGRSKVQPSTATGAPEAVSTPSPAPASTKNSEERLLTEKQIARYFAIRNKAGWSSDAVALYVGKTFKKKSIQDLTHAEYDTLCKYIERNPMETADEHFPFEERE